MGSGCIEEVEPRDLACSRVGKTGDFLGGPVVKTLRSHCRGKGSIPGQGTKIPHAARCGQKKKKSLGKTGIKADPDLGVIFTRTRKSQWRPDLKKEKNPDFYLAMLV